MRVCILVCGLSAATAAWAVPPSGRVVPGLERVCSDYAQINPDEDPVGTAATFLQDQASAETSRAADEIGQPTIAGSARATSSGTSTLFLARLEGDTSSSTVSSIIVPTGFACVAVFDPEPILSGERKAPIFYPRCEDMFDDVYGKITVSGGDDGTSTTFTLFRAGEIVLESTVFAGADDPLNEVGVVTFLNSDGSGLVITSSQMYGDIIMGSPPLDDFFD